MEGLRPILSQSPGFVSHGAVVGDDSLASISVFESQAEAEASNEAASAWVAENLAGLLPNPSQVTAGELYGT